jgi:hypothetical protein
VEKLTSTACGAFDAIGSVTGPKRAVTLGRRKQPQSRHMSTIPGDAYKNLPDNLFIYLFNSFAVTH